MRYAVIALGALCALATAGGRAVAQPAAAQAEVLFNDARKLMAEGKLPEACELFASSQKLAPKITTLLNLANCREKNGQLATAWGLFVEAERQTRDSSDAVLRQHSTVAIERARQLEPRLSKLTISVPADLRDDRIEILRDGERVDEAIWNRSLPVDGGTYKVTARAPGMAEWSTSVIVEAEGDTKTVDIPKLHTLEPVAGPADDEEDASATTSHGRDWKKVVPFAVGGGVALGVAAGLELSARSTYDKTDPAFEPDPARQDELWRSANRKRYLAQGLAVAGLASVGVAVWFYVRGNKNDADSRRSTTGRVHVEPLVGPDAIGIAVIGVSR